jgi:hypothetical protein
MNRGKPLQRKTPLVAKTRIKQGHQRLGIRRPSQTPDERNGRALVGRRSGGWCELRIDGVCAGPATDWQHRRNRSQGGTWAASNGIHTCRNCHRYIHDRPTAAVDNGWTVQSWMDWRTVPVLLFDGLALLDDNGGLAPYNSDALEAT